MKVTIITKNQVAISGSLEEINGEKACFSLDEVTPNNLIELSASNCTAAKLPSGRWYVIARFNNIESYGISAE